MTKGEYCRFKGLHTYSPAFNPGDELDDEFKNFIDSLIDSLNRSCKPLNPERRSGK